MCSGVIKKILDHFKSNSEQATSKLPQVRATASFGIYVSKLGKENTTNKDNVAIGLTELRMLFLLVNVQNKEIAGLTIERQYQINCVLHRNIAKKRGFLETSWVDYIG
ncbi:MAG: hypothetical protein HRT37_16995 [Alteromonadaceae bacterium]|nr:hypothetical protein [Alteromonadaceae bacterium]